MRDAGRRILVVTKPRYMGDSIVATPFLRHLRAAAPGAELDLMTGPAAALALQNCPYLDRVLPAGGKGTRAFLQRVSLVRSLRYDTVFLLNRSLGSALMAALGGTGSRIGHDAEGRGALLTRRVAYDWTRPDRDCALDLLRAEGLPADGAMPELWLSEQELDLGRAALARRGLALTDRLLIIHPGANDPHIRAWGVDRFAAAADSLARRTGLSVAITGAAEDRPVAEATARAMCAPAVVLAGEFGLRESFAALALARLFVGNDGGMLHAAAALCPSSVGIFGPTKAARWGYDTTNHRTAVWVQAPPARSDAEIRACLDRVEPDHVVGLALQALAGARGEEEGR